MIETWGFPGLVAASDAASKSAQVEVVTYQKAESGIVTTYIIGDVASVQSAVAIGKEEAKKVGQLRSSHVIPRPDEDVFKMIDKILGNSEKDPASYKDSKALSNQGSLNNDVGESLEKKTVSDLRKMASSLEGFSMNDQEIKTAKKEDLINQLSKFKEQGGGDA